LKVCPLEALESFAQLQPPSLALAALLEFHIWNQLPGRLCCHLLTKLRLNL
jgi:hypothetical protein